MTARLDQVDDDHAVAGIERGRDPDPDETLQLWPFVWIAILI